MSLANPAGLLFLLAAIPIVVIHMLRPRRAEAIVSSSMLWRDETAGATAATPWQRLPPSLLLLLQLLMVALLSLLLADPVTRSTSSLAEHTVVVLDASASMGALDGEPDRFADAKREALALVDEVPRGGRLSLVSAGPTPRVVVSGTTDMGGYADAVRAVRITDGPADLVAAMTLADGLETPDAQLGIVLISDGAHRDVELAALPPGVTHRLVGSGDVNHAVTGLDVRRTDAGLQATAITEVTGGGSVSVPLRFDVDDVTRAVVDISIEEGRPTVTPVDLPFGERVVARLGGDDLLAIDNTAYAVTRTGADLRVSVQGDGGPFLDALLGSLSGITVVDPGEATPEVTIYVGVPVPEDVSRPFIAIAPPDGIAGVDVTGRVENPIIALVRSGDPLLTGLDLSRLRVAEAQTVQAPTAQVLVAAEGAPLLLRGQRSGVPYVYLSFLVSDSTLPLELAFPVLGQRLLDELGGAVSVPPALEVGDPIVPPAGRESTIIAPNGTSRVRPAGAGAVTADRPGFWTIEPADGAVRTIAVSLGPEESDIDPLPVAPTDPRPLRPGEEPLSAERSWRWVVAVFAVGIGALEWWLARRRRGVPRRQWAVAGGLRLAAVALVVLGLMGPSIPLRSDRVSTVFVLDRSDSVGRLGATIGQGAVSDAARAAPVDGELGVVVTADGARIEQLLTPVSQSSGLATATIDGDRTDLASGLRLAGALLPDDTKRRIVVVSDGRATSGDAEAEARALGDRDIPVDYIVLDSAAGEDAAVSTITAPAQVDEGATVPITVSVESTTAQPAVLTLMRDGEVVATRDVLLESGRNRFTFSDEPPDGGLAVYSVTVDTAGDDRPQNDSGRTTVDIAGPAQVLVVEGTDTAGDELIDALRSGGLLVDVVDAEDLPALDQLIGYESTVLVDVSMAQLSDDQVQAITTATRELGRGLVTIGGPQSYGMGEYRNSELEGVLPVISDVLDPQRDRKVAQVMALDTSESMGECHCAEGVMESTDVDGGVNKTAIARAGAARAIANLSGDDEIGVLAVDTNERWLIELQELPPDEVVDSGLARATPSGNTDLSNTLPTAADALRQSNASLKHIILFTDGFTSEFALAQMRDQAAELRDEGITISVVATGEGAAGALEAIAEAGGGRFYPGRDLTRIPEILVEESILASRQFINEGEYLPVITDVGPIVDDLEATPTLQGYVATTSKDTARTLLRIGPEQDPLLASWRIGLGRATSWTSDANPRWSQLWVSWDGYLDFWSDVVRDTFPVGQGGVVRTTVDGDSLRIRAEADPGQGRVEAIVTTPNGDRRDVRLRETASGVYEGTVSADSAGVYAVGVRATGDGGDEILGSAIGSVSYAAEYRPGAADESALRRLSDASGGRGAISADEAFEGAGLVSGRRSVDLGSWLLIIAGLAWLAAAILSRLWLRRQRLAEAEPAIPERPRRPARDGAQGPDAGSEVADAVDDVEEVVVGSASTIDELLRARRERRDR